MIPQHTPTRTVCTRCRTRLVAATNILQNLVKVPLPTPQLLLRYHVDTPTTATSTNENMGRSVRTSPESPLAARIRSDQPGYTHIVTISKPRITTRNMYSTDDSSDDGSIAGYSSDISSDGEGYRCDKVTYSMASYKIRQTRKGYPQPGGRLRRVSVRDYDSDTGTFMRFKFATTKRRVSIFKA